MGLVSEYGVSPRIIRADLHMHGPIGFQPFYLRKQGYAGKNLLKLIADEAFKKGISISAITSHYETLDEPNDRFTCLLEKDAQTINSDYKLNILGDNLLSIEKEDKRLFLINGQTVLTKEDNMNFDILVVGSNKVPNGMPIKETLEYCRDKKLIAIAEHPFMEKHRGIGEKRLLENISLFDSIEGHNSQMIVPECSKYIPYVGKLLGVASSKGNDIAQKFANRNNKPWISVSDAHRIEDLGTSYIFWHDKRDLPAEEKTFIAHLKNKLVNGDFTHNPNYNRGFRGVINWLNWNIIAHQGAKAGKDTIGNEYTSCENL